MKIDFEMLDRFVEAGAPAKVIVEYLRLEDAKRVPKRERDKVGAKARRGRKAAIVSDDATTPSDIERHEATLTPSEIAEKQLFARGKQLFGPRSGGLISRLRQHYGYDDTAARKALETAATKSDPREYLLGSMRTKGNGSGNPTMAAFDDLLARVEGGAGEGGPAMRDITPGRDRGG